MKNDQQKRGCTPGCFLTTIITIAIVSFSMGIALEESFLVTGSLIIGGILIFLGILWLKESKQEKAAQKKTDALHQQMRAGQWSFPADQFLTECHEKGVKQLSTDYELRKATLIAQSIAEKAGMPQDCIPAYCSEEQVRGYFAAATDHKNQQEAQDRAAYEQKYKTPQKHTLSQEDLEYRAYAEKAREATPTEKHKMAIRYDLYRARQQLADIEKKRKHAEEVERYIARSGYQRPNDWATMGGIASGIAGPAAGAVVASQAIAENQAIQQQNAANMRTAVAVGNKMRDAIPSAKSVEEHIAALQKELEEASCKVVFEEYGTDELFSALSIVPGTKAFDTSLTVNLRITNRHNDDDPQVQKVIDGTLWMRAYCDDLLLDTVCVVLPRNGVSCDKRGVWSSVTLAQYMIEGDKRNYRFEFEPIRLWMTEQ